MACHTVTTLRTHKADTQGDYVQIASLKFIETMCLYPIITENPRYKKGSEFYGQWQDERCRWVAIKCGKCYECRQKQIREWRLRIEWEQRTNPVTGMGITLSFSEEALDKLPRDAHEATARALKLFRQRWMKKKPKAPRYLLVNELGQENTERLHLHGIIWEADLQDIEHIWGYGNIKIEPLSDKAVGYITKYIYKPDETHPGFYPKVYASKGIGKGFINSPTAKEMRRLGPDAKQYLRLKDGRKVDIPIYYRNKLFGPETREKIWIKLLDKEKRYVLGREIDVSTIEGDLNYERTLLYEQKRFEKMGYTNTWSKKKYYETRKNLQKKN